MIARSKTFFSLTGSITSMIAILAVCTPTNFIIAQEDCCAQDECCVPDEPRLNQNLIVGSVAIALVGAGVAVALSGHPGSNSSDCSSCLYSYSGGLSDWSSSCSGSDCSSSSSHSSSHSSSGSSSSSSHHSSSSSHGSRAVGNGVLAGEALSFTLPGSAPDSVDFTFVNNSSFDSVAVVGTPGGATSQARIPENSTVHFTFGNASGSVGPLQEGTYNLLIEKGAEAVSGKSIGTILVSVPANGPVVSKTEVFAP